MSEKSLDKLLSLSEVANIIGCGRSKVYSMIKPGPYQLPHVRIGRSVRVRPEELTKWIQSLSTGIST